MEEVVTVRLDIAKSVFQVHGVHAGGRVVVQRKLTRAKLIPFFEKLPPCRVGIEACATAHNWGRRLTELGHEVKLMPPAYVKPYLKRQKNDAARLTESRRRRPRRDQAPGAGQTWEGGSECDVKPVEP
jgi:transposase